MTRTYALNLIAIDMLSGLLKVNKSQSLLI
jgi:hypothetical protein